MKITSLLPFLALAFSTATTHGAITYSGFQNITIGNTFGSVYVDVDQSSSSPTQASGWDIDAFFGGEAFGNSAAFQPIRQTVAVSSAIVRLNLGDLVDGTDIYASAPAGSSTHIGNSPGQFASGTQGYLGFRLTDNNAAGPFYGWMRVNFSNSGGTGAILDWAYETSGSGISVGAIPEPSALALASIGCATLLIRRRQ